MERDAADGSETAPTWILEPDHGWPTWVLDVPYVSAAHPQETPARPIERGANCQKYAYAVLGLFGDPGPKYRSRELWAESSFEYPNPTDARDLDLALFNATDDAWGAHVAVCLDGRLLHLCAEVGRPVVWGWDEFERRDRYRTLVGLVRVPHGSDRCLGGG